MNDLEIQAMTAPADRVLVIERVFNAPRALVFKVWTDPAHKARWYGPCGFVATHLEADLRPGGKWRTCIRRDDNGAELWHGGVYREVVPPERLVFTFAWDTAQGMPDHETLVTITFAERQGQTLMTLRQEVFDTVEARDSHNGGWTSVIDEFAEYLATI
jgi:uncharacterized protein YndB with AHSA1/START domain